MLNTQSNIIGLTLLFICLSGTTKSDPQCSGISDTQRLDCYPSTDSNKDRCVARGCCWVPKSEHDGLPYCYFPKDYPTYSVVSTEKTERGFIAQLNKPNSSYYTDEIKNIAVEIREETSNRLRIRVTVPSQPNRWEPPIPLGKPDDTPVQNVQYKVVMDKSPFGLKVRYRDT
ncbi:unnamed protein product [Trichobilharzia regenti]|nr:unnamed protein product [Trichobilharzia regenti]